MADSQHISGRPRPYILPYRQQGSDASKSADTTADRTRTRSTSPAQKLGGLSLQINSSSHTPSKARTQPSQMWWSSWLPSHRAKLPLSPSKPAASAPAAGTNDENKEVKHDKEVQSPLSATFANVQQEPNREQWIADNDVPPPATPERGTHSKTDKSGLLTPPETPYNEDTPESQGMSSVAVFDPFTPPATPGDTGDVFHDPPNGPTHAKIEPAGSWEGAQSEPATPRAARYVRLEVSALDDNRIFIDDDITPHDEDRHDEHDSDSDNSGAAASTTSAHSSPEITPDTTLDLTSPPRTQPIHKTTSQPLASSPTPEPALISEHQPRYIHLARPSCLQCHNAQLPCSNSLPSCTRCTRRHSQRSSQRRGWSGTSALSASHTNMEALDDENDVCVPRRTAVDTWEGVEVVLPVFTAEEEGECRRFCGSLYVDFTLHSDLHDLESQRRRTYARLQARTEAESKMRLPVLPKASRRAVRLQDRSVHDRVDGVPVLRRKLRVDGGGPSVRGVGGAYGDALAGVEECGGWFAR